MRLRNRLHRGLQHISFFFVCFVDFFSLKEDAFTERKEKKEEKKKKKERKRKKKNEERKKMKGRFTQEKSSTQENTVAHDNFHKD